MISNSQIQLVSNSLSDFVFSNGNFVKLFCADNSTFDVIDVSENVKSLFGLSYKSVKNGSVKFTGIMQQDDVVKLEQLRHHSKLCNTPYFLSYQIYSTEGVPFNVEEYGNYISSNDSGYYEILLGKPAKISGLGMTGQVFLSFQKAINNSLIVSVSDKSGKITYVNPKFCEVSGYDESELLGQNHNLLNSGFHSKTFFEKMWQTISNGNVWREEVCNKTKYGEFFWVDTVIVPIRNKNGEIVQYISTRNVITDKVRVLNELKRSEALNQDILSVLKSNLAVVNANGTIILTNKSWQNSDTRSKKKGMVTGVVGDNYVTILKKLASRGCKNSKQALEGLNNVLNKKTNFFELEYQLTTKEDEKWYLLSITGLNSQDAKAVVRHVDITNRVLFFKKLAQNETRYKEIIELSNEIIFSFDLTGKFLLKNNYFKRTFKYKEKDLNALNVFNFIHKASFNNFKKHLKKVLNGKSERIAEAILISANGDKVYIEGNCSPLYEAEKVIGVQCFFRNITSSKLMLESLKISERKYKTLIENINDAIIVRDVNGKVKFTNQRFLHLIGLEEEALINLNLEEYIAPGWQSGLRKYYNNFINGIEKDDTYQYEGLTSNGTKLWLEDRLTLVYEGGVLVGIQTIIRDITEIKNKEFELKKLINELTNRNNEMMQFNYIVSHNLRSPIANIIGLANILSQTTMSSDEQQKVVQYIKEASAKMDELVKDLSVILFTKSNLNQKREMVFFHKLIQSICETLEENIIQSGCMLKIEIDENASHMFSIKSYLESIFYNLISNAIKYRSVQRILKLEIKIARKENDIVIFVKDNGIGINLKENGDQVFGLYKRFNFDTEGKGLGLHMTKTQVDALGGTIKVESEPDVGTSFIITFRTSY